MRRIILVSLGLLGSLTTTNGQVALFGSQQAAFFPTSTPQSCLAAFNTSLSCDSTAQLLIKQTDWVGWNATNLTALCTSGCRSSLASLQNTVDTACASWAGGNLGPGTFNASTMIEYILYKYDMTCLADGSTFCYLERQTWDIQALDSAGKATWPKYTNKTYYDWQSKYLVLVTGGVFAYLSQTILSMGLSPLIRMVRLSCLMSTHR